MRFTWLFKCKENKMGSPTHQKRRVLRRVAAKKKRRMKWVEQIRGLCFNLTALASYELVVQKNSWTQLIQCQRKFSTELVEFTPKNLLATFLANIWTLGSRNEPNREKIFQEQEAAERTCQASSIDTFLTHLKIFTRFLRHPGWRNAEHTT